MYKVQRVSFTEKPRHWWRNSYPFTVPCCFINPVDAVMAPRPCVIPETNSKSVAEMFIWAKWLASRFISHDQWEYWSHTHLIIDVVPGRGGMFSVEGPTGKRFLTRSRLYSEDEGELMKSDSLVLGGDQAIEGVRSTVD